MIKNFELIKKQLQELHPILNSFESEAVQLRIVELIFGAAQDVAEPVSSSEDKPRGRRRGSAKKANGKAKAGTPTSKAPRSGRPGPMTILNELADEGFFDEKRLLKDIVDHAKSQKARHFKQSDLSGPLGKLIRDKVLRREKNTDGQFEYYK
jgi:hypothetical protein